MTPSGPRWKEPVELIESKLLEPLSWRKPKRVFVNSMSDLFHEDLPDEAIDRVFAVMALTPHITYQILTKRPERMRAYFDSFYTPEAQGRGFRTCDWLLSIGATSLSDHKTEQVCEIPQGLPNVWLGVSVENQPTADARIPVLLQTPAAKRFVSYEPALELIDFTKSLTRRCTLCGGQGWNTLHSDRAIVGAQTGSCLACEGTGRRPDNLLHQIIIGGESGPAARWFNVEWARQVIEQCREAGVACFVKQMGSRPFTSDGVLRFPMHLKDRSGADPSEWPEELRVREFPANA